MLTRATFVATLDGNTSSPSSYSASLRTTVTRDRFVFNLAKRRPLAEVLR